MIILIITQYDKDEYSLISYWVGFCEKNEYFNIKKNKKKNSGLCPR